MDVIQSALPSVPLSFSTTNWTFLKSIKWNLEGKNDKQVFYFEKLIRSWFRTPHIPGNAGCQNNNSLITCYLQKVSNPDLIEMLGLRDAFNCSAKFKNHLGKEKKKTKPNNKKPNHFASPVT